MIRAILRLLDERRRRRYFRQLRRNLVIRPTSLQQMADPSDNYDGRVTGQLPAPAPDPDALAAWRWRHWR